MDAAGGSERRQDQDREEVLGRVARMVAERVDLDADRIRPDSDLERDLGMDSLSVVELQMALEEAYGVTLADEPGPRVRTVGAVADAVLAAFRTGDRTAEKAGL